MPKQKNNAIQRLFEGKASHDNLPVPQSLRAPAPLQKRKSTGGSKRFGTKTLSNSAATVSTKTAQKDTIVEIVPLPADWTLEREKSALTTEPEPKPEPEPEPEEAPPSPVSRHSTTMIDFADDWGGDTPIKVLIQAYFYLLKTYLCFVELKMMISASRTYTSPRPGRDSLRP